MDFFYYNNNNEKVRFNIEAGSNWDNLNIQNEQLNSIFSKIDDGDRKVSTDELTLLEKLFKKTDKVLEQTSGNKILENEELDVIINQIEKGEIKLPKKKIAKIPENFYGSGYLEIQYPDKMRLETSENSEEFFKQEEEKIKKQLSEKYPEGEYELEVRYNGRGYDYNVYCTDCDKPSESSKTLSQGINIIRADGMELGFKDFYTDEIADDDNRDYEENPQSAHFGKFTITDKNGNTHELEYNLTDCYDKDVVDCRRTLKIVADFIANLPEDTINKLIENNVYDIEFSSSYDDPFLADKNYYRNKMDSKDNVVDIQEGFATIISPTFAPPKREYKKEQNITREDGYNIKISDKENNSAEMIVKLPNNKQVKINVEGIAYDTSGDKFHQWQVPKLVDMLKTLPSSVLEDLSNEVTGVKFITEWSDGNGVYALGSNVIGFKADYTSDTPTISFVHELGHAIDNQNGTMLSKTPEFTAKFEELKTLMAKVSFGENYAMTNPQEFFASTYAFLELSEDKSSNNHIAEMDEKMAEFKDSDNPDKIKCYQKFEELKSDVSNLVNKTRGKSSKQRIENGVAALVKTECSELTDKFKSSSFLTNLIGESAELELIHALSLPDKDFENFINSWKVYADDKRCNMLGQHSSTPKEDQELFKELIEKALELRAKIKQ